MTTIPAFDYLEQYRAIEDEFLDAAKRVFESGRLILGSEVTGFEQRLSDFLGAPAHAVGVASGTDALVIALRAVGVSTGDQVITAANTAVATVSAIREVGARPRLCDADPETALMDVEGLAELLDDRVKAIVPVHLYGSVVDVPGLVAQIGGRSIAVVEDCAQALGSTLHGRSVGLLGNAGAFSFYPTKNLGAFGDGGACLSVDRELTERMRVLRSHGMGADGDVVADGVCSRLDELQAALLTVKLRHLVRHLERRREIASRYDRLLGAGVKRLRATPGASPAPHLYVVRVRDRDRVKAMLAERGIETGIHYARPIHHMTAYEDLGYPRGSFPHAERLAREVLSLPLYPELGDDAVKRVCEAVNEIVGSEPPG